MYRKIVAQFSTLFMLLFLASPTYAYLDPGTGSMIMQGLIAGAAMASITIKMYWYKLTTFFKKPTPESLETEEEVESAKSE